MSIAERVAEIEALIELASTDEDIEFITKLIDELNLDGSTPGTSAKKNWYVKTLAEVADFFGMSIPSVWSWRSMGMPGTEGRWDMQAISQWRYARLASSPSFAKPPEILELERRELELDVAKKELALAQARADFVEWRTVLKTVPAICDHVADVLQSLPAAVSEILPDSLRDELTRQFTQKLGLIVRKMRQQRDAFLQQAPSEFVTRQ